NLISDHVPEINRLNIDVDSVSFEEAIDSSEMSAKHWTEIAQTVFENYLQYDGFVVLHGSDTMAYTASALSFMFNGLQKPVILTGSQLPIGVIRTDGKENLITALEIAAAKRKDGNPVIREVAVYFDYKLFRGNRSTKDSAEHFEAFRSPNYIELGSAGVRIQYNLDKCYASPEEELSINTTLNERITLIKFYPGINFKQYEELVDKSRIDGVVLETFGAGNAPNSQELEDVLTDFIQDGGVVLNITQCSSGEVDQGMYKSSSLFNRLGVISGGNMTTEAAITKMMVCLDTANLEASKRLLSQDIRGEVDYS
ncbi:MAG: asparaginase, partial [Crocinitomicaceae bacterium]|nr:asparaginase [Crocinitomicaceae bacterium]